MGRKDETVEFENVVAIRGSGSSLLCKINGETVWIPTSQIHDDSEVFNVGENSEGKLIVTEWIAIERGLV